MSGPPLSISHPTSATHTHRPGSDKEALKPWGSLCSVFQGDNPYVWIQPWTRPPPSLVPPLSLLDHSSSQLTFSRVLLLFFSPSLSGVFLGWVLSSGDVRAFSLSLSLSLSHTHTQQKGDSKRLVCKASLEFICLNRFISPSVAPSLCPLLGKWVLA